MMIRRRTYSKRKKELSYGYLMLNNHGGRASSYIKNIPLNIYTSCMLLETPVGLFPSTYRTEDAKSNGYFLSVGLNDGDTIIVWTYKRLFKSTNGGWTWTQLASFDEVNWVPGNVAYMDNTAYYMGGAYQDDSYRYLVVYKYTIATRTLTKHTLLSILRSTKYNANPNGESYDSYKEYTVDSGSCFYNRVCNDNSISKNGLFIVWDFTSRASLLYDTDYYSYLIVDMPNLKYSAPWHIKTNRNYYAVSGLFGYWINDGSTNGYMILVNPAGSKYDHHYDSSGYNYYIDNLYHKIVNTPITYNNLSLSVTNITNTIKNKLRGPLALATASYQSRSIHVTASTCKQQYLNLIMWTLGYGDTYVFTTDCNYNSVTYMDKTYKLTDGAPSNYNSYWTTDTACITPDGKYGCCFTLNYNIIYTLNTHKYKMSTKFKDLEGLESENPITLGTQNIGIMLPKKSLPI